MNLKTWRDRDRRKRDQFGKWAKMLKKHWFYKQKLNFQSSHVFEWSRFDTISPRFQIHGHDFDFTNPRLKLVCAETLVRASCVAAGIHLVVMLFGQIASCEQCRRLWMRLRLKSLCQSALRRWHSRTCRGSNQSLRCLCLWSCHTCGLWYGECSNLHFAFAFVVRQRRSRCFHTTIQRRRRHPLYSCDIH